MSWHGEQTWVFGQCKVPGGDTGCQNLAIDTDHLSIISHRPCVAQWLERPLGVREAGVRSPTASHQSGRFALLSLAIMN